MLTGYPLMGKLLGRPGLGGYWGVSDLLPHHLVYFVSAEGQ